MQIMKRLYAWRIMSTSRKFQNFSFLVSRLITNTFFRWRLIRCGEGCIIQSPLFWTPEFISLGSNVFIWRGSRIEGLERYGDTLFHPHIEIGDRVSFQQSCHLIAAGHLSIGADTTISFEVFITDIDHQYEQVEMNVMYQPITVRQTRIGKFCFIGAGAKIQAGTTLGDHCVVGANAVVRGTFPDCCVIAGVPARIIKRRDAKSGVWKKTNQFGEFI